MAANDSLIEFRRVSSAAELMQGRWIVEPSETAELYQHQLNHPTTVVIPGVAFAPDGHRLGFGKGHFDRFLRANPSIFRIGVAYDFQLLTTESWPTETFDEPMDLIVTPGGIWGSPRIYAKAYWS